MYTGSGNYHFGCESDQDESDRHTYCSPFNAEAIINSTEYKEWIAIRERCLSPENIGTIKICKNWFLSFSDFLGDMGLAPDVNPTIDGTSTKYVIERIDESKPYCAENCRWKMQKCVIPAFEHYKSKLAQQSFSQQSSLHHGPSYHNPSYHSPSHQSHSHQGESSSSQKYLKQPAEFEAHEDSVEKSKDTSKETSKETSKDTSKDTSKATCKCKLL